MLKLTNLWENYDDFKSKLKLFDFKLNVEIHDFLQNNSPKNTLLFLLQKIVENNNIINIFDYTDNEKKQILSLINDSNNFKLVFENICLKLTDTIYNRIWFKNHINYDPKNYKITTTEEKVGKFGNSIKINYFCNGIKFLTFTSGFDLYCTIKNGTPSNIRNVRKKATSTNWDILSLRAIFDENVTVGSSRRPGDFIDDYHDNTWGYTGPTKPSLKYIHTKFKEYLESTNLID